MKEKLQKLMKWDDLISSFITGYTASIMLLTLASRQELLMMLGYIGILGSFVTVVAGKTKVIDKITKNNDIDRIIDVTFANDIFMYGLITICGIVSVMMHDMSIYIYGYLIYIITLYILQGAKSTYRQLRKDIAFDSIEAFADWTQALTTNSNLMTLVGASVNIILLNVVAKHMHIAREEMAFYMFAVSIIFYIIDVTISVIEYKYVIRHRRSLVNNIEH